MARATQLWNDVLLRALTLDRRKIGCLIYQYLSPVSVLQPFQCIAHRISGVEKPARTCYQAVGTPKHGQEDDVHLQRMNVHRVGSFNTVPSVFRLASASEASIASRYAIDISADWVRERSQRRLDHQVLAYIPKMPFGQGPLAQPFDQTSISALFGDIPLPRSCYGVRANCPHVASHGSGPMGPWLIGIFLVVGILIVRFIVQIR